MNFLTKSPNLKENENFFLFLFIVSFFRAGGGLERVIFF